MSSVLETKLQEVVACFLEKRHGGYKVHVEVHENVNIKLPDPAAMSYFPTIVDYPLEPLNQNKLSLPKLILPQLQEST